MGKENRPGVETEAIADSADQDKIYTQYSSGSCEYETYLLGFFEGRDSRQAEIDALNWNADRLYAEGESGLDTGFADDWRRADTDEARKRVVVDQVASLTDQSALSWMERPPVFVG